jgi:hypothetical protein
MDFKADDRFKCHKYIDSFGIIYGFPTIAFLYNLDILNNQYNFYCNTRPKIIKEGFIDFITAGNNRGSFI